MKSLFLIIVSTLLLYAQTAKSLDFNGTYTIGATGTYTNLTQLSNALKSTSGNTITGNCIFEIKSDYTTAGETFPIVFKQFTASNSSYTVTIRPQTGVGSVLTSGTSSTAIISLDSADKFIFDGRAGGSGSSVWTLRNTRTTTSPVFRLLNGACNNTMTYLIVESQNATTTSGNIYFQGTTNTTGNSDNTISYCQIRNRSDVGSAYHLNGIYSSGNASYPNSGNTIDNCEFYNHFSATAVTYAIFLTTGSTNFTITNNKIYQPSALTYTTGNVHMAIRINNNSGNNFTISNNTIGYSANDGTGTYTMNGAVANRFIGIYLTVGTTTASSVQGNKIANISLSTTSTSASGYGIFSGIYITEGKVNIGNSTANYIGDTSTTGNITIVKNTSTADLTLVNGIASTSTSTVNISNNIISGITFTSSSTSSALNFAGITTSGTNGIYTINSNKIGSYSTSNSIQLGISGTTTGAGRILGITNSATGAISISNNVFNNITDYCSGDAYFLAINSSSGVCTINNNLICNLKTYSSRATNQATPSIGGIIKSSTVSGTHYVNNNQIYNLSNENTTANNYIVGIYYGGPVSSNQEINGNLIYNLTTATNNTSSYIFGMYINSGSGYCNTNFIHSLSTSSSVTNLCGIRVAGSNINFYNNRLRLGIDASGNSLTSAINLYGINKSSTSSNNLYFNSIYIGGTGVGSTATNTIGYYRSVNTTVDEIKNNIIVNNRSNSTTGGKHYCYFLNGTNSASFDYNIYFANGTGGNVATLNNGTTARTSLRNVRDNFLSQDLHSAYGDPNFVNTNGNSSSVDLNLSGTTPAEASGISISGITTDYSGDLRSSYTPTDIGSDAGNFTASDLFTPNISYLPLANTTSTSSRTITDVNISDVGSGVYTSGGNIPTIWYRISSGTPTAWVYNAGSKTSGTGNSGIWSFTLDYTKLSRSPASSDVIQYYIVAQDQETSTNIWYEPFIGATHSSVTSQTTAPTTPKSYIINSTTLAGTYNIGTGGDYTTLTASGTGFFNDANSKSITGNITLQIISDITETGAVSLSALSMGGNSYSITIVPNSATERVISGNVSTALIKLNGADSIYIDGSYGGSGRYLRFRNTNTTSSTGALSFANGSCYNRIENCIIEGSTNNYSINFSTASGSTGNNYNLIINNIIRDRSDASSVPTYSIYSNGTGTSGLENKDNTISNNEIYNFLTSGMMINSTGNGNNWIIDGNHFYNNLGTTPSVAQYPIYINSSTANNIQIINNYIGGQSASCGGSAYTNSGAVNFYPIYILNIGTTTNSTIDNNTISNIRLSSTGASNFAGIYLVAGNVDCGTSNGNIIGSNTVADNIRIDGTAAVYGIRLEAGASNIKSNIIGNISQTNSTLGTIHGIYVNSLSTVTVEKNKVFKIGPNFAATSANSINGIRFTNTGSATNYYVYNNIVALGQNSNSTSQTIHGIYLANGAGGTIKIFYNSVFITGTASASTYYSYGFLKASNCDLNLKNNIFFNERSGSSSVNLAISSTNTGTLNSDYNLFVSPSSSQIARYNGTNYSFAGWQTASTKDKSSWSEITSVLSSANLFNDALVGDLSIINDNPECWYVNGNGIACAEVSTCRAGTTRYTNPEDGTTDIGVNEFDSHITNNPPAAAQSGTIAVGNTNTFTFGGKTLATIIWKSGTALPTSIDVQYFSGKSTAVPSTTPAHSYIEITQTAGTNFVYDIILPYTDAIIGLIPDQTQMTIAKSEDGITWIECPATIDQTAKTMRINNLNSFSQFNIISEGDCFGCGSVLPVEIISFNASLKEGKVELNWATASEIDNDYFTIERSSDAKEFVGIGQIKGFGNSNTIQDYHFIDYIPTIGMNYYRLKQVDYNGRSEYSKTIVVDANTSEKINVFQSKDGNLVLQFNNSENSDLVLEIYDLSGKLVYQKHDNASNSTSLTIDNLPKNQYLLVKVTLGNYQKILKYLSI